MADAVATPAPRTAPLDDVMLAMDVVDTLRQRERLVASELATEDQEAAMLQNLRSIYASQGIAVSDDVLLEGVAALREGRFVYRPPVRGPGTRWAYVYVNRAVWARSLLAALVVLALLLFGYDTVFRAPRRALVRDLGAVHASVLTESRDPGASARADSLYALAGTALKRGDDREARAALGTLRDLEAQLRLSYTLRIATDTTGVWRIPDINTAAENYYIIVEPFDAAGKQLTIPVTNEETGKTERVKAFGLRVPPEVFDEIRRDKLDDGIIQRNVFGEKHAGFLEPDYYFDTTGAAITNWD